MADVKNPESKEKLLTRLFYDVGKQTSKLELCYMQQKKDGTKLCSKWHDYFKAQGNQNFFDKANNRTILDVEIVLDIDPEKNQTEKEIKSQFNDLIKKLNHEKFSYEAYFTGSRGFHIHLIFSELRNFSSKIRTRFKEFFIKKYGCDIMKKAERCMIALENTPHWKTGKLKKLIQKKSGINSVKEILDEMKYTLREEEKLKDASQIEFNEDNVLRTASFPFVQISEDRAGFGIFLPKNKDIMVGGKKMGTRQKSVPYIITSDNDFYELEMRFEEHYKLRFDNLPEFANYPLRWSLSSIEKFIFKKHEFIDGSLLFKQIKEQYKKYLYFHHDTWYNVHALWDIGTYFFLLAKYYPLLELRGLKGTGKTKIMTLSRQFTFNATEEMTNPSEATLFRDTHDRRPTKYIDEAEKLYVNNKGKLEADPRAELINSGFKYTGSVPRQEKIGHTFKTVHYKTYSPTMIGSINGLQGATEDRAIVHITTRAPPDSILGESEPEESDIVFKNIRDDLYTFALQTWREFKEMYDEFNFETNLRNRDLWIWKPLLVLGKIIDDDLYREIKGFAEKLSVVKNVDLISEGTTEYNILKAAYQLIHEGRETVLIREIINRLPTEYRPGSKTVSKYMDRFGFMEQKKRTKQGYGYDISKSLFEMIVLSISPSILSSFENPLPEDNNVITEEEIVGGESGLKKYVSSKPSKEEIHLKKILKENPKNNVELIESKFSDDYLKKCLREGVIFKPTTDTYKIL